MEVCNLNEFMHLISPKHMQSVTVECNINVDQQFMQQ